MQMQRNGVQQKLHQPSPQQQRSPRVSSIVTVGEQSSDLGSVTIVDWKPALAINCCGRTLSIPGPCTSIKELQCALQDELGVIDQVFEIFDSAGARVLLDSDLIDAVQQNRTPLAATLSDASIHFIENRREELAQIQWKLVRDQHSSAAQKFNLFGRKFQDIDNRLDTQQKQSEEFFLTIRREMATLVDQAEQRLRAEITQFSERVAGVGQLVQIERNMREVGIEQCNKAMQSLRDTIDSDRTVVQQGSTVVMGHIDGVKKLVDNERVAREAALDKQKLDLQTMSERVNQLFASFQSSVTEYARHLERASNQTAEVVEGHGRTTNKMKNDVHAAVDSTNVRLKLLEDRNESLQAQLAEAQQRQADQVERLVQRHEKIANTVETMRFDGSQQGLNMQALAQKLKDLDASLASSQAQIAAATQSEREARELQLQSMRQAINSDRERLRSVLEGKIQATIAQESGARQDHLNMVLSSIEAAFKSTAILPSPAELSSDSTLCGLLALPDGAASAKPAETTQSPPGLKSPERSERSQSVGPAPVVQQQRAGPILIANNSRASSPRQILTARTASGPYPVPVSPARRTAVPLQTFPSTPTQAIPGAIMVQQQRSSSANARRTRSTLAPNFTVR